MKKLFLFIFLISAFIVQAQTDPDIWKLDLENRGYTVEETPRESLTLIVVKLSNDTVGIIESAGREGIYILRERLEGSKNLLACLTTAQRDTLAFKLGHQILNTTNDSIVEFWNGSSWKQVLLYGENIKGDTSKINVLELNGISADSIIGLDQVTGNLANSTTRADTVWSAVLDASDDVTIGGDLAVTGDMSTVQWTTYGGTSTIVGWTSNTSTLINYKKVGNLVFVQFYIDGVSDATNVTFTLPFTQISTNGVELKVAIQVGNNGLPSTTSGLLTLSPNSATVSCFLDMAGAIWTASNNKRVQGQFWYQAQ